MPAHYGAVFDYREDGPLVALLVILLIAALIFGVGGLIKGLFWLAFIGLALIGLTVVLGYFGATRRK